MMVGMMDSPDTALMVADAWAICRRATVCTICTSRAGPSGARKASGEAAWFLDRVFTGRPLNVADRTFQTCNLRCQLNSSHMLLAWMLWLMQPRSWVFPLLVPKSGGIAQQVVEQGIGR